MIAFNMRNVLIFIKYYAVYIDCYKLTGLRY